MVSHSVATTKAYMNILRKLPIPRTFLVGSVFWTGLFASPITCQVAPESVVLQANRLTVDATIAKVDGGNYSGVDVEALVQAGDPKSRPVLEKQFSITQEPLLKAKIAEALEELGSKDDAYWRYLVQLATPAIESDAPDIFNRDTHGKEVPGLSPAFVAWAEAHHQAPDVASENAAYIFPGEVDLLGAAGDPKSIPLLRRGLNSPNYLIQAAAARGLVNAHDSASTPLILEALRKAPVDVKPLFAQVLIFIDDPKAQAAVDATLPSDWAASLRASKARGGTVMRR